VPADERPFAPAVSRDALTPGAVPPRGAALREPQIAPSLSTEERVFAFPSFPQARSRVRSPGRSPSCGPVERATSLRAGVSPPVRPPGQRRRAPSSVPSAPTGRPPPAQVRGAQFPPRGELGRASADSGKEAAAFAHGTNAGAARSARAAGSPPAHRDKVDVPRRVPPLPNRKDERLRLPQKRSGPGGGAPRRCPWPWLAASAPRESASDTATARSPIRSAYLPPFFFSFPLQQARIAFSVFPRFRSSGFVVPPFEFADERLHHLPPRRPSR